MRIAARYRLVLLGLLLFLPGIGSRDLWNPDEPRYAEVAREMRVTGQYFVPHLNGRIYAEKPPLLFWMIAGASFLTGGVDEISARLPSLLAAVAALCFTFGIARRLVDDEVAWATVLILGTSARILWQGRVGQIDMLLLALVAFAMYCFVRGWLEQRPIFFRCFFVAAGLATLAKGPVGLLPPLLAAIAFALLSGGRSRWRELGLGSGIAIWATIVSVWLVPAAWIAGRPYLQTILFKQNVQRFADPWHHLQPFYYYLTTIPADFFPWTFFLPGAIWLGAKRLAGRERAAFLFAVCWVSVTVLFFSISPAKRTVYVLQMFPGLALLVALFFAEVKRHADILRRWIVVPADCLAFLLALVPIVLSHWVERQSELVAAVGSGAVRWTFALSGLLAVAAVLAAAAAARRPQGVVPRLAGGMVMAALIAGLAILPRFDALKSARPLSTILREQMAPDEPYAIYPRIDPAFVFYTEKFCELPEGESELRAWIAQPGRRWLLVRKRDLARLDPPLGLREFARDADASDGYVLAVTP